ncbi:MAG: hypothetical protein RL339_1047 [Pseudomonadota bacterium]|jgi:two-component system sensor kinase FixL
MIDIPTSGSQLLPSHPLVESDQRELFLQTLINAFPDVLVVIDTAGTIVAFGDSVGKLLGYAAADLVGQNVSILMPEPDRRAHPGYIQHYLETDEKRIIGVGRTVRALRRDGRIVPVDLNIQEALIGTNRLFIGFLHDATEADQQRRRLASLSAQLAQASRISSMGLLASAIAHELNQPLAAIRNYVEALSALSERPGAIDPGLMREAADACSGEVARAGEMIRRLRDFLSQGNAERAHESLHKLATNAIHLALADGEGAGVELKLELDAGGDAVLVDGIQVQQVIFNLLRNALQAMATQDHKFIRVGSCRQGEMVEVVVDDIGPGIHPDRQLQLFKPFGTTTSTGMGLGLSITQMIVEAHGGRIWLGQSQLGGTAFHFTLPLSPP